MAKWEIVERTIEGSHMAPFDGFGLELHGQPVLDFLPSNKLTEQEHHELCLLIGWALRLVDGVRDDPHIKSVQVRMIMSEIDDLATELIDVSSIIKELESNE